MYAKLLNRIKKRRKEIRRCMYFLKYLKCNKFLNKELTNLIRFICSQKENIFKTSKKNRTAMSGFLKTHSKYVILCP